MKYYDSVTGFSDDGLLSVNEPVEIWTVGCLSNAELERGMLIASTDNVWAAAGASDTAGHPLGIVNVGNDGTSVASAYVAGAFNEERIICASGIDIEDFRQPLRAQGIWLKGEQS